MKRLFLLLMLPLLAISFNSCSDDKDKDEFGYEQIIIGTWKLTEITDIQTESPDENWMLSQSHIITFNSNKTFKTSWIDGEPFESKGTYTISGNKLNLTHQYDSGNFNRIITIVSANSTEVVFKMTVTRSNVGPNVTETHTAILTIRAVKQQ